MREATSMQGQAGPEGGTGANAGQVLLSSTRRRGSFLHSPPLTMHHLTRARNDVWNQIVRFMLPLPPGAAVIFNALESKLIYDGNVLQGPPRISASLADMVSAGVLVASRYQFGEAMYKLVESKISFRATFGIHEGSKGPLSNSMDQKAPGLCNKRYRPPPLLPTFIIPWLLEEPVP